MNQIFRVNLYQAVSRPEERGAVFEIFSSF